MKRKLKRPITLAGSQVYATTDRTIKNDHRTTDTLLHSHLAPIEVQNPQGEGKILVMRNLRCDPLGRMHDRGQIDEAQFKAGDLWRDYYAITEVGGSKAIDFTKEAVDGGGFRDNRDSDRYNKAFTELGRAAQATGILGEQCLKDVLANRMFLNQVAVIRNITAEKAGDRLKDALEKLAVLWGFAMRSGQ